MAQRKTEALSVNVSKSSKKQIEAFVKKTGTRAHRLFEQALVDCLEDEMDRQIIKARQHEPRVAFNKLR